ncbi:MAG: vitamin K epoxide reductase family protein [Chlamydiae bacterium]|nr:vitamin K epoxide reductase family protein [Chlamydiota bacterium]
MTSRQISFFFAAIGLWLLAAPVTFGYNDGIMILNDQITGVLLVILGFIAAMVSSRGQVPIFLIIGLWLSVAPLVFWALEPIAFLNDTLVGMIVLFCAFRYPGMQGRPEEPLGAAPPGWSFNPSGWGPRTCTIFLAMLCWFLSRYLSAYQLGYIQNVWDPFFGSETVQVLTSHVADFFPVSDAGLGAFAYSLEAFLGFQGNSQRWRTMPWLVILFGILVVPAGLVSIVLIVLQPIVVGAWCGLCLVIASCMLVMIMLTISEVVATLQFLIETKKSCGVFWPVFWKGARAIEAKNPIKDSWGISAPRNLALTAALGVWLMLSPSLLQITGIVSYSVYIAGPILVAVSIIYFEQFCLRHFSICPFPN